MTDIFFQTENFAFSVSIAIVLIVAFIEGVGSLVGFGLSSLFEGLSAGMDLPDAGADIADADADIGDASLGEHGAFARVLAWIRFGEVPVVVLLIAFLTCFGLAGFAVQGFAKAVLGGSLPAIAAIFLALLASVPATRVLAGGLAKVMPKEETEAVSQRELIGRVAVITLGEAAHGKPAQGKVKDSHGLEHYVMIEPDGAEEVFSNGCEVLLVRREGGRYFAISNDYEQLRRQT